MVIPSIKVTASDNCTPVCDLILIRNRRRSGTIVPGPNATVTVTVTDLCGNSSSCTALVEGVARSGLIVNWPASVTSTNCLVPCVFVTATDCLLSTAPRITQYPPCGTPVGPGINSVTVTVTDCNGAIQTKVIPLHVTGEESFLSSLTNTGISLTGTLLAPSAVDPHYTMSMTPLAPPPGYTAPDTVVVDSLWGWLEVTHVSQWIAPMMYFPPNYNLGSCQGGIYTYEEVHSARGRKPGDGLDFRALGGGQRSGGDGYQRTRYREYDLGAAWSWI